LSTSTPNATEARHQAAPAPSPARRDAEVAGSVPYRRHRGTLSEQEIARDGNGEMPRQLIGSDRLTRAVPYHYVAAVTGVTLVFSAGACPLDGDGRVVAAGEILGQTRQSIENHRVALEEAGCTQADVVKTTIFVASPSRGDLLLAWNEYRASTARTGRQARCSASQRLAGLSSSSRLRRLRRAADRSRCASRLLPPASQCLARRRCRHRPGGPPPAADPADEFITRPRYDDCAVNATDLSRSRGAERRSPNPP
jgi:enamine deaminase RidA (YjgF/YER057c/UK114 family)